jgi:hypothetical protein
MLTFYKGAIIGARLTSLSEGGFPNAGVLNITTRKAAQTGGFS